MACGFLSKFKSFQYDFNGRLQRQTDILPFPDVAQLRVDLLASETTGSGKYLVFIYLPQFVSFSKNTQFARKQKRIFKELSIPGDLNIRCDIEINWRNLCLHLYQLTTLIQSKLSSLTHAGACISVILLTFLRSDLLVATLQRTFPSSAPRYEKTQID